MDENKLVNLLKDVKTSPEMVGKLEGLLKGSAESLQLLRDIQMAPAADKEHAKEAFLSKQKQIVSEYEKLLSDMGLTKEMLEEYASNPKNFSPESWQFLESFKKEISAEAKKVEEPAKVKKSKSPAKSQWLSA